MIVCAVRYDLFGLKIKAKKKNKSKITRWRTKRRFVSSHFKCKTFQCQQFFLIIASSILNRICLFYLCAFFARAAFQMDCHFHFALILRLLFFHSVSIVDFNHKLLRILISMESLMEKNYKQAPRTICVINKMSHKALV